MYQKNDLLFLKLEYAKSNYVHYKKEYDELIAKWLDLGKQELSYFERDKVKNLNKLNDIKKKKVILGIMFNYYPSYSYDAFRFGELCYSYIRDSKGDYKEQITDNVTFRVKDHDGLIYVANKNDKQELNVFYKNLLSKELWKYAVERENTKLGLKEWIDNFSIDKILNKAKSYDPDDYSESLYHFFEINTLKVPKLISKDYLIAFSKKSFKKSCVVRSNFDWF